jgi:adenosylcobinamide kinase / adenosylcobinamide-phosphate guanylyltransferase
MSELPITARLTLVTGAARSGKSDWAERLAKKFAGPVTYVATAKLDLTDTEWLERIAGHRQRRPAHWQLIESPKDLAAIVDEATSNQCLLIDSLGTWVANFLEDAEVDWLKESDRFLQSLRNAPSTIILVSEETGWGLVPVYPLGRLFRDRLGTLTRQVGAIANPVYLVAAGRVLDLAKLGQPLDDE